MDKYINEFLDLSKARKTVTVARMRGCIDGKPAGRLSHPDLDPRGDRAKVWHPLPAAGLPKPLGDWTIVARDHALTH